jgi:hypothetical protein
VTAAKPVHPFNFVLWAGGSKHDVNDVFDTVTKQLNSYDKVQWELEDQSRAMQKQLQTPMLTLEQLQQTQWQAPRPGRGKMDRSRR